MNTAGVRRIFSTHVEGINKNIMLAFQNYQENKSKEYILMLMGHIDLWPLQLCHTHNSMHFSEVVLWL